MPNWCNNLLEVSGPPTVLQAFDRAFRGRPAQWQLPEPDDMSLDSLVALVRQHLEVLRAPQQQPGSAVRAWQAGRL